MAKETQQRMEKRILVLCVDRDGDLGQKAEVKTPVIGRRENLDAAVNLALNDPEEPDANAIFEAVRVYDKLKAENKPDETFEVATISGTSVGGVKADRKIVSELAELLGSFPAGEVILVVDGYSDEAVLPLVQSRVPVSSVSRIVVKHSESIEETAAIFSRYAKMLVNDPRYARFVLGLPGLLLIILATLYYFNLLSYFLIVAVFVVSGIMLIKGFGADRAAKNLYRWTKEYSPPPLRVQISSFAAVAGGLCVVLGVYLGWANATIFLGTILPPADFGGWVSILPQLAGYFIMDSITLIVVGVCAALSGRAIRWYLERDARLLRNVALIVSIIWLRQILGAASSLLIRPELGYETLIYNVLVGILIGVASVLVILVVHRSFRGFFLKTGQRVEEFGED